MGRVFYVLSNFEKAPMCGGVVLNNKDSKLKRSVTRISSRCHRRREQVRALEGTHETRALADLHPLTTVNFHPRCYSNVY